MSGSRISCRILDDDGHATQGGRDAGEIPFQLARGER
jgi:hypothetical protein